MGVEFKYNEGKSQYIVEASGISWLGRLTKSFDRLNKLKIEGYIDFDTEQYKLGSSTIEFTLKPEKNLTTEHLKKTKRDTGLTWTEYLLSCCNTADTVSSDEITPHIGGTSRDGDISR